MLNRYVRDNPGASPHNLESLEGFMREMAYAIGGMESNDIPALETVRNYWKCFTARWRRKNPEIPTSIAESVTNVCLFHGPQYLPVQNANLRQVYLWPIGRGDEDTSQKKADEVRQQISPASTLQGSFGRKIGLNIKTHQQEWMIGL
jgi:hypothetical protein